MLSSRKVILEVWQDFAKRFGRAYSPVESYKTEDADVLLFTMGSLGTTAMLAADQMREKGKKVGVVKLRLWRPFPFEEVRKALSGAKVVSVLDRCISFGGPGGPVCSEIRSAVHLMDKKPKVIGFIGGLGGRDFFVKDFEYMVDRGLEIAEKGSEEEYEMIGVRE